MSADQFGRDRWSAPAAALFLGDDEIDGAVAANFQYVIFAGERGVHFSMLDVGAKATKAGQDGFTRIGVFGDFAR